jgi:hypothetical protein
MERMNKLYQAWLKKEIAETELDEDDDEMNLKEMVADSDNYKELAETFRNMLTDDDKQEVIEYLLGCDFGWDDKEYCYACIGSDPCFYWIQFKLDGEGWTELFEKKIELTSN